MWVIVVGLILGLWIAISRCVQLSNQNDGLQREAIECNKAQEQLRQDVLKERSAIEVEKESLERARQVLEQARKNFDRLREEYFKGFPLLCSAWADYQFLMSSGDQDYVNRNCGLNTNDRMRNLRSQLREMTEKAKQFEYLVGLHRALFPQLADLQEDASGAELDTHIDDTVDPAVSNGYLTKEEWGTLSPVARDQLALDRYWDRKKSKLGIGLLYEQYVGWKCEKDGYSVRYQGHLDGFNDMGIDLVANKGIEVLLVQCKFWSMRKQINWNHVMQLYGAVYYHTRKQTFCGRVRGVLCTLTTLSKEAREVADELGIKYRENCGLGKFPMIKCNKGSRGERIYHLPMDQMYWRTNIEAHRGEYYAMTVQEAVDAGFRRAWRWRGSS